MARRKRSRWKKRLETEAGQESRGIERWTRTRCGSAEEYEAALAPRLWPSRRTVSEARRERVMESRESENIERSDVAGRPNARPARGLDAPRRGERDRIPPVNPFAAAAAIAAQAH